MSGPGFIILFLFVVLLPVFRISKLRLSNDQKFRYRSLAIVLPIIAFAIGRIAISAGLIESKLVNQTQLEQVFVGLIQACIVFGSWLVFIVARRKQQDPSHSNSEVPPAKRAFALTQFWVYVFLASGALFLAFISPSQSESRAWVVVLWGLFGCFPWWLLLPLISSDPNGQFTLVQIVVMSILNALLLYAVCQARLRNVGLLHYIGYQFGRGASRLHKWH